MEAKDANLTHEHKGINDSKIKKMSPVHWHPFKVLGVFAGWVFLAEFTDVFILHDISFSSRFWEVLVDTLIMMILIAPTYFLFYLPLKEHWLKIQQAQDEVQILNHRLLAASEDERSKLALELHDHFGQVVTKLQCKIDNIRRELNDADSKAREECLSLEKSVAQLGEDIRRFTSSLRPDMLDHIGLVETLKWYVAELQQHNPSLQISFQAVGIKKRLPAETEIAIYRVCQEALNNIIKHANARTASLKLVYSHPMIILTIRDDGDGLSKQETFSYRKGSSGLGLLGMRERIASIGGTLEFSSQKGDNTTLRAKIPVLEANL